MTSIDDLFKKPSLPSGSIKRKFEAPDAQQSYKATKLSNDSSPNGNGMSNGKSAQVEDANDEDDDTEAGPSLPPEDEEGDDEEGRFFGGGVTRDAAEALDYIDQQEDEDIKEEKIDATWLRRFTTSFERKVTKNAELRAKFEADPSKFMASEADLDAEIKNWSLLSEHPELYPEFATSGAAARLVELLAHENTDIAIGAIEIISELLDEDVQAEQEQWDAMVAALLEADLLALLMSNLARLDENEETDRSGVYHSLSVLENLASQQAIAETVGTEQVLDWLCHRIQKPEKTVEQNKQYAAEVLQVLLQSSPLVRKRLAINVEGVDLLLQLLAAYRKRDPVKDSHEEEFAENLFDALTCVLDEPAGKRKFIEAEGVELALIMLKEGSFSRLRALRLLDHAMGGAEGAAEVCSQVVEAAGLKTLFGAFVKKSPDAATTEHLLGTFSSLLRWLPGDSAARIRTLSKFEEKDYEKISKLVSLRNSFASKIAAIDEQISLEKRMMEAEDWPEREPEWFSRRLDGGLFCLQTVDVILAWLVAEANAAKERIVKLLGEGGLEAVRASLGEQMEGLEDEDTREMLGTLKSFLG